jgi:hypothetical protein
MPNTNCLEGIRCPDCGNEDAFYIESTAIMYVTHDGAESRGDTQWNDESHAQCEKCQRSGKLAHFKAKPPAVAHNRYIVGSSHGEFTIDIGGYVVERRLDNDDADGGRHLKSITRFDLAEWREYWGDPELDHIDILGLGYWYTNPKTDESAFEPPDAKWRSEIAEILLERRVAAEAKGGVHG